MQTHQADIDVGTTPSPGPPRRKAFRARLNTMRDVQAQCARLFRDARSGALDVADASRLANILAILGRMIEGGDLEARLEALERRNLN